MLKFDPTSGAFQVVVFLTGIAGAFQTPVLSLFLSTEVQVSPVLVGFFFTGSAAIGIIVSQVLAWCSDRKGNRKTLIFMCCILGALGCILFAYNRNYFILLFAGVFFSSFGSTTNPQVFALAREHADKTGREAAIYISILRANVSLAWVVGPPVAFFLASDFSFKTMYLISMLVYVSCALVVLQYLPSTYAKGKISNVKCNIPRQYRQNVCLLFIACSMMWGCECLYFINMPLYIISELHMPDKLAGLMMGTAALLEIPVILISGYYAKQFGKRILMFIAAVSGALFYLGMLTIHNAILLLTLQLMDAIFIGILAGVGMSYFQDIMPGQTGMATTLYTNTTRVGWLIAGVIAGMVSDTWNHHTVFYIPLLMISVTLCCLLWINNRKQVIHNLNDK